MLCIYFIGIILYGVEGLGYKVIINNYEDVYFYVECFKEVGVIFVKSYN